jgi:hypothetical protein
MAEEKKRLLPAWMPNPIDSVALFGAEALTVVALGVAAICIAALALWIY